MLHHEFIKAGEDAEIARANVESQRLAQMAVALEREKAAQGEREKALSREQQALRRGKRALAAAAGLFVTIVLGAVGLRFQAEIKRQWFWLNYVRGYALTPEQARALDPGQSFRECARIPGAEADAPRYAEYSANCPEMVVAPAGRFIMGTPPERGENRERPQVEVTIAKPFAVSKYEITAEHWNTCVAYGGCGPGGGAGKDPVSSVSWHEAKYYVAWLSQMTGHTYRLLSNSEWEYVARAGSTADYWWGEELGKGNANCATCGSQWDGKSAAPVGSFKPNAFGLYDVHGNVWEWVEDPWHDDYIAAPADGSAWLEGGDQRRRVIRGGAWYGDAIGLRVTRRGRYTADDHGNDVGFRVARTLAP
jgi:formylglycine-generating enzyme required for sulfatase activity